MDGYSLTLYRSSCIIPIVAPLLPSTADNRWIAVCVGSGVSVFDHDFLGIGRILVRAALDPRQSSFSFVS
jgi:hypothetical protein